MPPASGSKIAFPQERTKRFQMRRDERLAAFARDQREMGRDDPAASCPHGVNNGSQSRRQRRNCRRAGAAARIGAIRMNEIPLQIDEEESYALSTV